MRIFALDTNILSYILKKDEKVLSRLLVTNNTKHFETFDGLDCVNWK